jgi:hypothetical protein
MGPLIRDGDWVDVVGSPEPPPVGSLVLARTESNELVCHRNLGELSAKNLLLAGDRSSAGEEHEIGSIFGSVSAVSRDGRTVRLGAPLLRWWGAALARLRRFGWSNRLSGRPGRLAIAVIAAGLHRAGVGLLRLVWIVGSVRDART